MMSTARWSLIVMTSMMLACNGDEKDGNFGGDGDLDGPEMSVDADLIGIAVADWRASDAGSVYIEYGLDGAYDAQTPAQSVSSGDDVSLTLMGLKPDQDYDARVILTTDDGTVYEGRSSTFTTPPLRDDTPTFELVTSGVDGTCGESGYVAVGMMSFSPNKSSWVLVLDRDGDVVWARPEDDGTIMRLRKGEDGASLLWSIADVSRSTDAGAMVREAMATSERTETRLVNHHHDFLMRPDGQVAWLSYDFRDVDGIDSSVAADTILEDDEGVEENSGAVEVFNMFDDYEPGIWETGVGEAYAFIPGYYDFSHGNSLMMSEDGDHYYISFRWLDAVIKIERDSGDVLWQLGGDYSDFSIAEEDRFSHTHMSEMWDDGMLIFDNADNTGRVSGAVEYTINEATMAVEKVWEYRHPEGKFTSIMGDAARVKPDDCDGVLIAWASEGRLQMLDRDYETTWEVDTDVTGIVTGRVVTFDDIYTLD